MYIKTCPEETKGSPTEPSMTNSSRQATLKRKKITSKNTSGVVKLTRFKTIEVMSFTSFGIMRRKSFYEYDLEVSKRVLLFTLIVPESA